MRHGKSDWNAEHGPDHERPLNARGIASARVMGRVLSERGLAPDLAITSSAVRALSTARLAAEEGKWECDIVVEPGLYGSGTDDAVDVASRADPVDRLMLVGHQPTWSVLVSVLTGEQVDMKTATVAVIDFDIDQWSGLPTAMGVISDVLQPRDYLE